MRCGVKLLRKVGLIFTLTSVLLPVFVNAEPPEMSEFEKWQQSRKQQFDSYVSAQDKNFSQFLKQRWLVKKVEQEQSKKTLPKITKPPVAPKKKSKDTSDKVQVSIPERKIIIQSKEPKKELNTTEQLSFLGHALPFEKAKLPPLSIEKVDADGIAESWNEMAKNKSEPLLKQLSSHATWLGLDDWATAFLTYQYINHFGTGLSSAEVTLYTWYYLVQQGFDTSVGYESASVYLLLNVEQMLYGQKFFRFANDKYYFVDFSDSKQSLGKTIKTYQNQHAQAKQSVVIDLGKVPLLAGETSQRDLSFKFSGKSYEFSVPYSKEYVALLNQYPQLELKHYFQTDLAEDSKQALLTHLAKAIEGKTEQQALNLLLRFVQKAFAYQTDDQQFNEENFLLATETLHYPYADCEDRSVLFSYLVKNLLGNKVIGVLYKGHIATAVKAKSPIEGAAYRVNGDRYIIADPTYIGASIGQVMPGYEQESPKLIPIN